MTSSRGNRLLLGLALAAGAVAAVLVFVALSSDSDSGGTVSGGTTAVVVASQDINAGTEITDNMIKVSEVSDDLVVSGAETDTSLVVGQVARVDMLQGEQVAAAKIGVENETEGVSGVIPPGKRGIALSIDEVTAVGGLLLPGNKVDIVATYVIEEGPGIPANYDLWRTQTILQDVEVISVAQEAQEPLPVDDAEGTATTTTSGELPEDVEEQPDAGTVTVALDPGQVQLLISAQEIAERVWASLRPYGEGAAVELQPYDQLVADENIN
jgi:pilus assembly protein CpaB